MPDLLPDSRADLKKLRPFTNVRLVVLDLDGTVVPPAKEQGAWSRFISLKKSLEFGKPQIRVAIATGRTLTGARHILSDIEFSETSPSVFYNGSLVTTLGRDARFLFHRRMEARSALLVLKVALRHGATSLLYFAAEGLETTILAHRNEILKGIRGRDSPAPRKDVNLMTIEWSQPKEVQKLIEQIPPTAIVFDVGQDAARRKALLDDIRALDVLPVATTTSGWLELRPAGIDKAVGLEILAQRYGLEQPAIAAVGDGENDLEMLAWAGVGIAVKGSAAASLLAQGYITNAPPGAAAVEVLDLLRNARDGSRVAPQPRTPRTVRLTRVAADEATLSAESLSPSASALSIDLQDPRMAKLVELRLVPLLRTETGSYALKGDLLRSRAITEIDIGEQSPPTDDTRIASSGITLKYLSDTSLELPRTEALSSAALISAARVAEIGDGRRLPHRWERTSDALGGTIVTTASEAVVDKISQWESMISKLQGQNAWQAVGTTHYMGSKRALGAFLSIAADKVTPVDGIVVDLMCGSGAASGAFACHWDTISSDALDFCKYLARVQGKGLTQQEAELLERDLFPIARQNAETLENRLRVFLDAEGVVLRAEPGDPEFDRHLQVLDRLPTFPSGVSTYGWDPVSAVTENRQASETYCLITSYFANVYFGIRQAIEIDSLRFAISTLTDRDLKDWALGALIATTSSVATTYGGHFAQPALSRLRDVPPTKLLNALKQRSVSVFHDFALRLRALGITSQSMPHEVKTVPGPWEKALDSVRQQNLHRPVTVYLDPPYKRDEYSRYYHVLETLVRYDYPSSTGKGRLPDKSKSERFASEFATRDTGAIEETLVRLLNTVLREGWSCLWSYSSNADASPLRILEKVASTSPFSAHSYATPFTHRAHGRASTTGRRADRAVEEYVFALQPD